MPWQAHIKAQLRSLEQKSCHTHQNNLFYSSRHASKKAFIFALSLMRGLASTPLATSTAYGLTCKIALYFLANFFAKLQLASLPVPPFKLSARGFASNKIALYCIKNFSAGKEASSLACKAKIILCSKLLGLFLCE